MHKVISNVFNANVCYFFCTFAGNFNTFCLSPDCLLLASLPVSAAASPWPFRHRREERKREKDSPDWNEIPGLGAIIDGAAARTDPSPPPPPPPPAATQTSCARAT